MYLKNIAISELIHSSVIKVFLDKYIVLYLRMAKFQWDCLLELLEISQISDTLVRFFVYQYTSMKTFLFYAPFGHESQYTIFMIIH